MAETVAIERDEDAYWNLAKAFMRVLVVETNEALKSCGVNDAQLRQQIASQLGFGLGNFFDQYWFEVDGKRFFPFLCFCERFPQEADSAENLGTIQAPVPEVELHAMAQDESDWFFTDQKEDKSSVLMGFVGDDESGGPGS